MHMADALLAPATGVVMWAISAGALGVAARQVRQQADDRLVPLMGMLGAFVFAAQMVNFAIPGTGSSGHLGGGLLLALLLGPWPALVVMASVLAVQALVFADGGLLALGANIFNLGVLPCLVAYPLIYRPLAGATPSARRRVMAVMVASVLALQMGAAAVVAQTMASGISSLPAGLFALLMLPMHGAIGMAEGMATAALLLFVLRHRPDLLHASPAARLAPLRRGLVALGLATLCTAGAGSWLASSQPDGLEWSVERAAGGPLPAPAGTGLQARLAQAQHDSAWMPDYALPHQDKAGSVPAELESTLASLLGGLLTLGVVLCAGLLLRARRRARG